VLVTRIETGYHDATVCAVPGFGPVWVAWCRVDGNIVDARECDDEDEARQWCEQEEERRA
jgi:hypothetical protein